MATKEEKMNSLLHQLKQFLGNDGRFLYEVKEFMEIDLQCNKGEINELTKRFSKKGIEFNGTKLVCKDTNYAV